MGEILYVIELSGKPLSRGEKPLFSPRVAPIPIVLANRVGQDLAHILGRKGSGVEEIEPCIRILVEKVRWEARASFADFFQVGEFRKGEPLL